MNYKSAFKAPSTQDAVILAPKSELPKKVRLEDVIEITANVCMQKDICQHCGRGDRYGLPLHFLLHFHDSSMETVCFACGKNASNKTGVKLPRTESDIFAREEDADLRKIQIARQKMGKKQFD